MFGRRADATEVKKLSNMRRMMPYISPRRNESLFYMMQEIGVDAALEFVEKRNAERPPERPLSLFHLFLRATAQACHLRPGVNRFVKGGRLWQRNGVYLTFSAKREIKDGSPMLTIKREFPAGEGLDDMVDGIYDRLQAGRSGKETQSDKEMKLALKLPNVVIKAGVGLLGFADRFGLLPSSYIEPDPLYCTVFCANLGSIDYPAGFHHLWEYGTASIFGVMGKIEPRVGGGGRKMNVAWSYDERIEDGLYSYYTLELIRKRIEDPESLVDGVTPEPA